VLGKVIVLSAVGSTTVSVVSKASAVVPSNTIEVNSAPAPAVIVGLVIIGDVKVLFVRVCALSVPTTSPSPEAIPCIAWVAVPSLYAAVASICKLDSR
jgi:hypothetical protein